MNRKKDKQKLVGGKKAKPDAENWNWKMKFID